MATSAREMMTARQVVLMTPAEKRAIAKRARDHGRTPSEWIRLAASEYEVGDPLEEAALNMLADEIEITVKAMHESIARIESDMAFHRAEMSRIKAGL